MSSFSFSEIQIDSFTLFGIIIFICHVLGEICFKFKILPRISLYIILGIIFGPNILDVISEENLINLKLLIDIAIAMILFLIGRHLDFDWLKNDKGLLYMSLTEFFATFILSSFALYFLGISVSVSLFAGIIAATTSPAVLILTSKDLSSEGPITRRSLVITSINNFLGIVAFTLFSSFLNVQQTVMISFLNSFYQIIGSITLAYVFFKIYEFVIAKFIEKTKQQQFIILISQLILITSFSKYFNLSIFLSLITFGIFTRNFDKKYHILEVDLGWLLHLFLISLFFITGAFLNFFGFFAMPVIVFSYIFIRFFTKSISIFLFKKKSVLTNKQAFGISAALTPMTGVAVGMTSSILDINLIIGKELLIITSSAIAFWGIIGSILTQMAFISNNEAFEGIKKV